MHRTASGFTLIETLISTVIMSVISFAFMSVLLVNYKTNAKLDNMQDTINAIRTIKERIAKDVREGRSLGDVYGTDTFDAVDNLHYVVGSSKFPSTSDPIYGSSAPSAPTGWPAPPWTLSNQCLVVQIPVLDDHADTGGKHFRSTTALGWPTQIPAIGAAPPQDNVETHVYRVVADANNAGEYTLQYCSFAGAQAAGATGTGFTGYQPSAHNTLATGARAETLITGIIGPLDSNGLPKIFQFVNPKNSDLPIDSIPNNGLDVAEYTGVVCNMEIRRHQSMGTTRKDISLTPIGMKLEVFLRNNALATSVGQPASNW
jgi:prepilin-type N-terminal cleavage/methylation domain-containing protein